MMSPCLDCGEPTPATRCPDCRPPRPDTKTSSRARGYDTAWRKLSERARRLQPFCTDCGSREDLTADHLPIAWQRKNEGKPIRLCDIEVVCRPCNSHRGRAKPSTDGTDPRGGNPDDGGADPLGEANFSSHSLGLSS